MSEAILARLLAGAFRDPDGGATLSVPTRHVAIGRGLRADLAAFLDKAGMPAEIAIVSDPATRAAVGPEALQRLTGRARMAEIVLGTAPHPDMAAVARVRSLSTEAKGLMSVGSGSVTDIVKYAAHLDGKPFVAVATAPSMNGYTSMNAAITVEGHKRTLPATPALGVLFDLDVLVAAPTRMIRAGFADSLARATAQTDWLMAHRLLGTPYRTAPFALLADDEPALIAEAAHLLTGDGMAMARLARVLALSGFGMTICGGSYPASQGEHLVSHLIEMLGNPSWPPALHGEQIAVTTLTMARLQEDMLARDTIQVRPEPVDRVALAAFFGDELGAACAQEMAGKALTLERAADLNVTLARCWAEIRPELHRTLGSSARILTALQQVGAPTTPEDIQVPRPFYDDAVLHARKIRGRFTFLDLAAGAGLLQPHRLH